MAGNSGTLGFPITFDDSPMAAVEGQVLRALSKQDIEALFSKGVLLDLCALETLIDMGYGDLAGADIKDTFIKNSRRLQRIHCCCAATLSRKPLIDKCCEPP